MSEASGQMNENNSQRAMVTNRLAEWQISMEKINRVKSIVMCSQVDAASYLQVVSEQSQVRLSESERETGESTVCVDWPSVAPKLLNGSVLDSNLCLLSKRMGGWHEQTADGLGVRLTVSRSHGRV